MFDQQDDQNNQQHGQDNGTNDQANDGATGQPQSPAAPPPDHDFAPPKPAYDSVFDEQPTAGNPTPSDDNAPAAQPPDQTQPSNASVEDDDELLGIKQQALEQLSPLVGQLEQSPEEKFHTTMRIIQASDNHSLVKDAYDAARQIEDDKVRAQALLDIINEINYFTKDESTEDQPPQQPS